MSNISALRNNILRYLGCPYVLGACGEGPDGRYDQRPLDRADAFDCLTYVNHVLAKTLAIDVAKINYSSDDISYFTRCHYMTADWLPHNIQAGRLAWVTDQLGFETKTVTRDFDRAWFFKQRTKSDLHVLESAAEEEQLVEELQQGGAKGIIPISITYIGWNELQKNLAKLRNNLPPISIMLVVRPGDDYVQTCGMVTHLGFVLNENSELFFVHAKHNESVQQEKLSDYLARFEDSPSVEGASFLRVL